MTVTYSPAFIRQLKKLPPDLRAEAIEKIELFKDRRQHKILKVHKLSGLLKGRLSFSVNYRYRIVFVYLDAKTAYLLAIGDHDIYK